MAPEVARLIDAWLDGVLTPDEADELDRRLQQTPSLVEGFRERVALHGLLTGVLGDATAAVQAMDKIRNEQTQRTTTSVLEAIQQRKRIHAGHHASRLRSARQNHPAHSGHAMPDWLPSAAAAAALALALGLWLAIPSTPAPRRAHTDGSNHVAPGTAPITSPDDAVATHSEAGVPPGVFVALVLDAGGDVKDSKKSPAQLWRNGVETLLRDGEQLLSGDRIDVPGRGRVRLSIDALHAQPAGGKAAKPSTLYLRGKARVTLQRAQPDGDILCDLESGQVQVRLESAAAKNGLRVQTPHLVATVTGTEFSVHAMTQQTRVDVKHGEVRVSRPGESHVARVHGGETLTAREDGPLMAQRTPKPVPVRPSVEIVGLLQRIGEDLPENEAAFEDDDAPPSSEVSSATEELRARRPREKGDARATLTDAQGRKITLLRGKLKKEDFARKVNALNGQWVRVRGKGPYRKSHDRKSAANKGLAVDVQDMEATERVGTAPPMEPADGPTRKKPGARTRHAPAGINP